LLVVIYYIIIAPSQVQPLFSIKMKFKPLYSAFQCYSFGMLWI